MGCRPLSKEEFVGRMLKRLGKADRQAEEVRSGKSFSARKPKNNSWWFTGDDWLAFGTKCEERAPMSAIPKMRGEHRCLNHGGKSHAPKTGKTAPKPVVRDDGVRYHSISEALEAAGYDPGGQSRARDRIMVGKAWRDGHVYRFEEVRG